MQFTLDHSRDVINQRIHVLVRSDAARLIVRVRTTLDMFVLGDDPVDPPSVQYERTFRQVGTGGPGQNHKLVVTARGQDGNEESATSLWQDDN